MTSSPVKAISAIVVCCLSLASGDALIKWFSIDFSLWQLFVLRSGLVVAALIVAMTVFAARITLIPHALGWVLLRSLLLAGMWISFYAALPHVDLSLAAAVVYTTPLMITMLSALLGGDRVSGLAWAAIALGFAGVLLIVRPGIGEFNGYELLPLLAAAFYALAMVFTRLHMRQENTTVLALWLNLVFVAIGLLASVAVAGLPGESSGHFLLGPWQSLGGRESVVLVALAAFFLIGNLLAAYAYQHAPAPLVATFDYSYLVFSTALGFFLFGERPDAFAIVGMALIAMAGISAVKLTSGLSG